MRQSLPNHSVTASWKSSRQRCVTRVAQRGSKVAIYSWMHLSLCRDQRSADGPNAISLFPSPALSWPNTTRHWRHEAQMCRLWERVVIMWLGVWKQHLLLCQLVHTHWKYGFISASVSFSLKTFFLVLQYIGWKWLNKNEIYVIFKFHGIVSLVIFLMLM